jgi:hypothetical protein
MKQIFEKINTIFEEPNQSPYYASPLDKEKMKQGGLTPFSKTPYSGNTQPQTSQPVTSEPSSNEKENRMKIYPHVKKVDKDITKLQAVANDTIKASQQAGITSKDVYTCLDNLKQELQQAQQAIEPINGVDRLHA